MKHVYTKGPLSWCKNASKEIRKKGFDAYARLNVLRTVHMSKMVKKYMANQNDSHLSSNHGLKHSTSLADLHWSALRIGLYLDPSTIQHPLGSSP